MSLFYLQLVCTAAYLFATCLHILNSAIGHPYELWRNTGCVPCISNYRSSCGQAHWLRQHHYHYHYYVSHTEKYTGNMTPVQKKSGIHGQELKSSYSLLSHRWLVPSNNTNSLLWNVMFIQPWLLWQMHVVTTCSRPQVCVCLLNPCLPKWHPTSSSEVVSFLVCMFYVSEGLP